MGETEGKRDRGTSVEIRVCGESQTNGERERERINRKWIDSEKELGKEKVTEKEKVFE